MQPSPAQPVQAKGVPTELFKIGPENAFAVLWNPQQTNLKLVKVAIWLVDEAQKPSQHRPR